MIPTYHKKLKISNWLIKKDHLNKLFDSFNKRLSDLNVEIDFEDKEIPVQTFKQFDRVMKREVIELKKKVKFIQFSGYKKSYQNVYSARLIISINSSDAEFTVRGTGSIKVNDWVQGFYGEAQELFSSFEANQKIVDYVKNKDPDKYRFHPSVIFFDYENSIETKLQKDKKSNITNIRNIHYGKGDNIGGNKNIKNPGSSFWGTFIGQIIIGLILILVSLVITSYFRFQK